MRTVKGYSKDPTIMPEAIMLTLPKAFFEERKWDYAGFIEMFQKFMAGEDNTWNYRLTNLPKHDVLWVYLIFDKKIQFRVNIVMYERNKTKVFKDGPDKKVRRFPNSNWVILSGPAIRPDEDWPQKGHQGFRYATKLF